MIATTSISSTVLLLPLLAMIWCATSSGSQSNVHAFVVAPRQLSSSPQSQHAIIAAVTSTTTTKRHHFCRRRCCQSSSSALLLLSPPSRRMLMGSSRSLASPSSMRRKFLLASIDDKDDDASVVLSKETEESNGDGDNGEVTSFLSKEEDQVLLGVSGIIASLVTLYSEFTLKTTGCGLPAGPLGLVGLAEGLSYLGVTGLAALSLITKLRTQRGLPSGPGGILGAAEGLAFLAIVAGLVVLAFQIVDYGYIPNAVPGEGAMCK